MIQKKVRISLPFIVETAVDIANQDGIESVTMATLAKRLAIRPPSLYNHVEGIAELRAHLSVHGLKLLYHDLAEATIGKAKEEAIYALADAYLSFARSYPGIYELTLSVNPDHPEHIEAGERIVDLIVQVLSGYQLSQDAALHAVRGLRSILHGFASIHQKGGFKLDLDLDHSLRLLLDGFILSLGRGQG